MDLIASEVMHRLVKTVPAQLSLLELDRRLVEAGVSGFAVVDEDRLVGVVSRADILRALDVERIAAHATSDFYRDSQGFHEVPLQTLAETAARIGERLEQLTVRDVMHRELVAVSPDQSLRTVAELMLDRDVHRVLVTRDGRLLGLISSSDFARLYATGRIVPKE
jgi:CBS domain-containing protein